MIFVQAPIEFVTPNKRYSPVGYCIYCSAHSKLTKEHIIPHGLAGDSLILPQSSCKTCAAKTRDWETACLRHLWWPFRTRIGAPHSKKQKPESFIVRQMRVTGFDGKNITSYDKVAELKVDPMDFPFVFMSYKFLPPGVLVGRDIESEGSTEVVAQINQEEFKKYAPNDKDGFRIAPMNLEAYCRMLAKIAHAYAVAELGYESFRPALRRFIRGKPFKPWHWIGSEHPTPPSTASLHDIRWLIEAADHKNYVVVELRLFSFMNSPRYRIVVGELKRPTDQLPFLQQPLYTIDVKTTLPTGELLPIRG